MDLERFKAVDPTRVVFNGPDEQFISGLIMGASGGIGGTYASMVNLFLALKKLLNAGKLSEATALQTKVNDIIILLAGSQGNLYAALKRVLQHKTGIDFGSVREPLLPLGEGDEARVLEALRLMKEAEVSVGL